MNPALLKIQSAFPSHLRPEVDAIFHNLNLASTPATIHFLSIRVGDEILEIPYRIYLDETNLSKAESLTTLQRELFFCIHTRHHNGRVREQSLRGIIPSRNAWVTPYVFLLGGEYVREILDLIFQNLNTLDATIYREFIDANPLLYEKTRQRMVSYWDGYYRREFPNKEEYVGFKLFNSSSLFNLTFHSPLSTSPQSPNLPNHQTPIYFTPCPPPCPSSARGANAGSTNKNETRTARAARS